MSNFNKLSKIVFYCLITLLSTSEAQAIINSNKTMEDVAWGLYCPADVHVSCHTDLSDLSQYGWAYVHDYNGETYLYDPEVEYHLSSCNTGYITRTWSAQNQYSGHWHSCTQTIHVNSGSNGTFGYNDIYWPEPYLELEGCDPETDPYQLDPIYGPPTYNYIPCSHVGVSYSDRLFTVNSTCKKIIRTWKVIDWCQYNTQNQNGRFEFEQTIKIMDSTTPTYTCPSDITVSSQNCVDAFVQVDPVTVDAASCGGIYQITNLSPYSTEKGADISGTYPVGTTKVKVVISYGCGFKKNCWVDVTVAKDKPPVPYCSHSVVTALMPVDTDDDGLVDDGMVEIWAKDLDKGSRASCGHGPLTFSFSSDIDDQSRTFTCANAGRNPVQVWVTDRYGNQDWCLSYIEVQNNGANIPNCEPLNYNPHLNTPISALGTIQSTWQEALSAVDITLTDMDAWLPKYVNDTTYHLTVDTIYASNGDIALVEHASMEVISTQVRPTEHPTYTAISNDEGVFLFQEVLAEGASYMVKGKGPDFGVGTIDYFDANAIMSHILGYQSFQSPYEYLAADVNQDGEITTRDFIALFNHIKYGADLPVEKTWILLDKNYVFEKAEDALNYCPDEIHFSTQSDHVLGVDFIAVELGDITNRDIHSFDAADQPDLFDPKQGNALTDIGNNKNRSVFDAAEGAALKVFPNPFSEKLNITYHSPLSDEIEIRLFASDGQLLQLKKRSVAIGENLLDIRVDADYKGILLYSVTSSGESFSGRLIKH